MRININMYLPQQAVMVDMYLPQQAVMVDVSDNFHFVTPVQEEVREHH